LLSLVLGGLRLIDLLFIGSYNEAVERLQNPRNSPGGWRHASAG